jgi:hypothetical protein
MTVEIYTAKGTVKIYPVNLIHASFDISLFNARRYTCQQEGGIWVTQIVCRPVSVVKPWTRNLPDYFILHYLRHNLGKVTDKGNTDQTENTMRY